MGLRLLCHGRRWSDKCGKYQVIDHDRGDDDDDDNRGDDDDE